MTGIVQLAGVPPCCQLINGSGGDRCTEADVAVVDALYKIGPDAKKGLPTETLMLELTRMLNHNSIVSKMESMGVWFPQWLRNMGSSITLSNITWPRFQNVVDCIDRQHIAIGGFNDYRELRLVDGGLPWPWALRELKNLGHVVVVIGYDLSRQGIVVIDTLRLRSGQPAVYSWASFQAAQFHDLSEVHGTPLPFAEGSIMTPTPATTVARVPQNWSDDGHTLHAHNGQPVVLGFRDFILHSSWDSKNVPLEPEQHASDNQSSWQVFLECELCWNTKDGVYLGPVGQDLLTAQQQVATLEKKVGTLAPLALDLERVEQSVAQLKQDAGL